MLVGLVGSLLLACSAGPKDDASFRPLERGRASLVDPQGNRPNILVVDIDSLRADRIEAERNGEPVAPTLRTLARGGVRFEQAYAQSGWTVPSLLTLLTGRYPTLSTGSQDPLVTTTMPVLPSGVRTLPEILGYYGYHCRAFWGGTVPGSMLLYWRGFEVGDDALRARLPDMERPGYGEPLRDWLAASPPEPFFALLHDLDLHHPRPPFPPDQAHRYASWYDGYEPVMLDALFPRMVNDLGGDDATAQLRAYYDAYLAGYDEGLARVFEDLEASGLAERTLVVVTSNHGEELNEAGYVGHNQGYRDALLHVPLILSHPALPEGLVVSEPVQGVDLAPTLLELAGVPKDQGMHGVSLAPRLSARASPLPARPIYASNLPGEGCYRKGKLKLTGGLLPHPAAASRPEVCRLFRLYDLARDPLEVADLCPERAKQAEGMLAQLQPWIEARVSEAEGAEVVMPDESLRRIMQERGYWDAEGAVAEPGFEALPPR